MSVISSAHSCCWSSVGCWRGRTHDGILNRSRKSRSSLSRRKQKTGRACRSKWTRYAVAGAWPWSTLTGPSQTGVDGFDRPTESRFQICTVKSCNTHHRIADREVVGLLRESHVYMVQTRFVECIGHVIDAVRHELVPSISCLVAPTDLNHSPHFH